MTATKLRRPRVRRVRERIRLWRSHEALEHEGRAVAALVQSSGSLNVELLPFVAAEGN